MIEMLTYQIADVPVWNWLLQACGVSLAVAGAYENAKGKIGGFHLWIASNVFMAVLHAQAGLWGLLALDFVFTLINLKGVKAWQKSPPTEQAAAPVKETESAALDESMMTAIEASAPKNESSESFVEVRDMGEVIARIVRAARMDVRMMDGASDSLSSEGKTLH